MVFHLALLMLRTTHISLKTLFLVSSHPSSFGVTKDE